MKNLIKLVALTVFVFQFTSCTPEDLPSDINDLNKNKSEYADGTGDQYEEIDDKKG